MARSAKFRNVAEHPAVAFTVEDRPDRSAGAGGVRFVEVRGYAEPVRREAEDPERTDRSIIRIHPRRQFLVAIEHERLLGREVVEHRLLGDLRGLGDVAHRDPRRLQAEGVAGRSRYEIVRVLAPAPDVALAHVRRVALDDEGEPIPSRTGAEHYSELALYVLVRRFGRWRLAAGHNTIMREDRGALAEASAS